MRRSAFLPLLGLALALPAAAQGPGAPPPRGPMPGGPMQAGPGPAAAEMLLASTGALHLTDAQVVRLAAIARRAEERRQATRASMEAARPAAARQQPPSDAEMQRMRQAMEQVRAQAHADLRDALAVLTADQQAMAFEQLARHAGPGRPGAPGAMRGTKRREGPRPGRERGPDGPGAPDGRGGPPPPARP